MVTSQVVTIRVIDETGTAADTKVTVPSGTSDSDAALAAGIPAGAQTEVVERVDVVDDAKVREQLADDARRRAAANLATESGHAYDPVAKHSRTNGDADGM
jgi:hypothetical protein